MAVVTNLAGLPPLGQKVRHKNAPGHLERVRLLPCIICVSFGEMQRSPTEAHHPICGRHSTEKVPDHEAIPLCHGHHTGDMDTSKLAIHRNRAAWVEAYGSDRDYIAVTQDMLK